jgi:hypothetical protein
MKKLLLALFCISTITTAFPAFAGPDWQLIEQARKAKHLAPTQTVVAKGQVGMEGMMKDCMDSMDGMNPQAATSAKAGTRIESDIYGGH